MVFSRYQKYVTKDNTALSCGYVDTFKICVDLNKYALL